MKKTIKVLMALCLPFIGQAQAFAETSETLQVWMNDIAITADGETITKLTVYENDVQDYASFNMSFNVPAGVRIAQVDAGRGKTKNDVEMSARATEGHSITCNQPTETLIKVSCISLEGENLYPDDEDGNPLDELFTIGLVADPNTLNGTYTITLGDLDFGLIIDGNGNMVDITLEELPTFQMTITGGQDALTIPYTLSSAGVGTICLPFDANVPEGLAVFTTTEVKDNTVQLTEQTRIEAGTPLIVAGKPGDYSFRGAPSTTGSEFTKGLLSGTTVQKQLTTGYVIQTQDDVTGFYLIEAEKPITLPAYHCWLTYDIGAGVPMLRVNLHTGINGVDSDHSETWYGLDGRHVTQPQQTGVYIKDGTKQMIKP